MASKAQRAVIYEWVTKHQKEVGAEYITDWITERDNQNIRSALCRYHRATVRLAERNEEDLVKLKITIIGDRKLA